MTKQEKIIAAVTVAIKDKQIGFDFMGGGDDGMLILTKIQIVFSESVLNDMNAAFEDMHGTRKTIPNKK